MTLERQASALPPAQPSFIFRGHAAPIHSVRIVHQNRRLVTGDADGWIVYWRLESKRPIAVWKAHEGAILGISEWQNDKFITHGRDHTLRIWQLRPSEESNFSTLLPAEGATVHRPSPWLIHSLPVNTLNFCEFSMCHDIDTVEAHPSVDTGRIHPPVSPAGSSSSILVAVPARDDRKIDVYQFPNEKLRSVVPRAQPTDTGMVMAVKIAPHPSTKHMVVIAGYEGGFTAVHLLPRPSGPTIQLAHLIYMSNPHTQPILSLDVSPDAKMFFTSSADAIISAHQIPDPPPHLAEKEVSFIVEDVESPSLRDTSLANVEANNQSLGPQESVVSALPKEVAVQESESLQTGKGPITMPESLEFAKKPASMPATLPSHSFKKQPVSSSAASINSSTNAKPSGLSSLLSSAPSHSKVKPPPPTPLPITMQAPIKSNDTKHAGQQSLRVRADGRLLITGGWDSRARVYSTKTLKEVAVLKWHKEGVYAVDFGQVLEDADLHSDLHLTQEGNEMDDKVLTREHGLGRLQRQREEQLQLKHWVAVGAKDGKVSLWEVF